MRGNFRPSFQVNACAPKRPVRYILYLSDIRPEVHIPGEERLVVQVLPMASSEDDPAYRFAGLSQDLCKHP